MPFQQVGSSRPSLRMLLFVLGILLILLLTGCSAANSSANTAPNSTPNVNTGTPNTDTTTPTATTATSADTPTPVPTQATAPTPTPVVVPFRVTGVNAAASPSSYSGLCNATKTITMTGTIYAPANSIGGTVTYEWTRSDNSTTLHHFVTFARGVTAITVISTWALTAAQGNGTKFWASLKTLTPEVWISSHATFSFTCKREIAGVSATVTPATGCTTVAKIFVFTATITLSSSPSTSSVTVTYAWKRSNGTAKSFTVIVPAGQTSVVVTPDSWTLAAKGTYTDKVVTSAPNSVTSNTAKITC